MTLLPGLNPGLSEFWRTNKFGQIPRKKSCSSDLLTRRLVTGAVLGRKPVVLERQDIEIAQEIQEQLVRQAEQQRRQEEKDAAIARKLHEKEMKEERRRQKGKYEEDYFEDHGGHVVHKGSGSPIAETEYGLTEVTKGLTNLDLREQELKDLEVARRLQEEELKVRKEKHAQPPC
ncbi:hypothetical protein ATANTOWER_004450 [Ataeniobius toweri]|uniref:Coiled-coil domain-containing protein n=1 Tax=Ataeniobius toweri TaxID=208326 RepID=A0ABU7C949_9TELE|nr:hypothetical protein [Ataeniobius toweri]